ncbi:MAG: indole-3-glycerol phosphate synthase TrpC [Nitrospirae bacterium]|nr:MAG: indole-3-glycerol phosphate synthase TrpC [Nitrospirota bacterium]
MLAEILKKKQERLADAKRRMPFADLKSRLSDIKPSLDFAAAIRKQDGRIRLIAELKKASPSKGLIRKDFEPAHIASIYEEKGASAISVLTEEDYFQGHLSYIAAVKNVSSLPALRKDFIFDAYQIYEARANHADAILLMASVLERGQAAEYLCLAHETGLSVLFEVHNEDELETAFLIKTPIIGINNRDLKTLKIDLSTTFRLKAQIPAGITVVAESGIKGRDDVRLLEKANVDAVLIGTAIMSSQDIGKKIEELLG